MSSANELAHTRTYTSNYLNQSQGTTTHFVTLSTPNTGPANSPLSDPSVPPKGTVHPCDPATASAPCVLDSYDVTEQMDGAGMIWKVVAKYASFHGFSFSPGLYQRENTFTIGTVEIPYAVLVPRQFPSNTTTPALVYIYDIRKLVRERKNFVATIKTWVTSYSEAGQKKIAQYVGKYVYLSGSNYPAYPASIPYKFHGAQVSSIKPGLYQLTYTFGTEEAITFTDLTSSVNWDAGPNPGAWGTATSPQVVFPPKKQGSTTVTLQPYQKYVVIPSAPLTVNGPGTYYQLPPTFATVSSLSLSDIFYLQALNLPGNPESIPV